MASRYVVELRTALTDLYDDPLDEEVGRQVVELIAQRPIVGGAGYSPADRKARDREL